MTLDQATDKILYRIVNPATPKYYYNAVELSEELGIPIEMVKRVATSLMDMNYISMSGTPHWLKLYPKILAEIFVSEGKTFENPQPSPFLDIRPKTYPSTAATIEAAKTGIRTSLGKFIMKHVVPIVITILTSLLIAYLIYQFGWL